MSRSHDNFRRETVVAAVTFDLRVRATAGEPLFVKSRDLAPRVGYTVRQVQNALRFAAQDDNGLDISQWSGAGTYPKVWEVYHAE